MIEQYSSVIVTILIIIAAWIALRFLLRLTARVFSCGCLAVVGIDALVLLARYFSIV